MAKSVSGKPTMKDVALEAGVALGTVSKVINGIPVGEEYRILVEQAIERLDYHVNTYARGLKTNKTYCISVILPNVSNPYFSALANALYRAITARGYSMMLCLSEYDASREQELIDMTRQNRVDGIIGLTYNPDLIVPEGLPFIAIDRYFNSNIPCISSDNYGGGRLAAEKLIELGCKKLLFMRTGSSLTNEPNRRKDGFVLACQAKKIPFDLCILEDGQPIELFAQYLAGSIHNGHCDYDGIFCVTDYLAHRVRRILDELKIRVPDQVQIIGFDGIHLFGDQEYACSTIVQPVEAIAENCVRLLLTNRPDERPSQLCLPVFYAYGGTTKDHP